MCAVSIQASMLKVSRLHEVMPDTRCQGGWTALHRVFQNTALHRVFQNTALHRVLQKAQCLHAHTVHGNSIQKPAASLGASCALHVHGWAPA